MPGEQSPTSDRPAKRSKVFRACQSCVSAKTRCEDVQPEGCYLCRRKGKDCSLRGISSVSEPSQHVGYLPDPVSLRPSPAWAQHDADQAALLERLRAQEERSRDLEDRLHRMEHLSSSSSGPTPGFTPQVTMTHHRPSVAREGITRSPLWNGRAPTFDERLFLNIFPAAYPDVVALGYLTRSQMDMAFQLFKHRFSLIFPFNPFLRSSTSTPEHPFVRLAVLLHVNIVPPQDIANVLDQSLAILLSGGVSIPALLALLIVSLVPVQAVPQGHNTPTSLRLISLAYQIGLDAGVGRAVETSLRNPDDLLQPWADEKMELALLWTAVVNRYNLLRILFTPVVNSVPSPASLLPAHPSDSVQETVAHLNLEAELTAIADDYIRTLVPAEDDYGVFDLQVITAQTAKMSEKAQKFRSALSEKRTSSSLLHDAEGVLYSLVLRLGCLLQNLPSPLSPEPRLGGLSVIGTYFVPKSIALVRQLADLDPSEPSTQPGYILMLQVIGLIALRRTAIHTAQSHGEHRTNELEGLQRLESKIHAFGGAASVMLIQAEEQFGKWPEPLVKSPGGGYPVQDGHDLFDLSQIGLDWMNFLMDPTMGEMPNIGG
ncbi:hypothetical protein IAU60_000304 [Kwoniella sp. DSM 27419]